MICEGYTPEQRAQAINLVIQALPHLSESQDYLGFIIMSALTVDFVQQGKIPQQSDWNRIADFIGDIQEAETATKN